MLNTNSTLTELVHQKCYAKRAERSIYKLKKKYYKLKNGDFLDLQENNEIDFIDKLVFGADINYKELESGSIKLRIY